ncbi:hypothetical protein V6N13_114333 [Hibiscus sabdariffa]
MFFSISLDNIVGLPIIVCGKGGTSIEDLVDKSLDMIFKIPIDVQREIKKQYYEVRDMVDILMVTMFEGSDEGCQKEFEAVERQYPFEKLKYKPKIAWHIFKEGIQMLKDVEEEQREVFDSFLTCLIYLHYRQKLKIEAHVSSVNDLAVATPIKQHVFITDVVDKLIKV